MSENFDFWQLNRASVYRKQQGLPSVQLSREATVLGFAREELRHDSLSEQGTVSNDESTAMWKPTDSIMVSFIPKDGHHFLWENVLAIISVAIFLLIVDSPFQVLVGIVVIFFCAHLCSITCIIMCFLV
jgi:hypothetical protein